MNLLIEKWGNSLSLRLPADYVHRMGLKEGDQVEASFTVDGGICLRATRWDRQAFSRELERNRADMPMTESLMDQSRLEARY
ncbi:MAG: AbrB/MazE/SpoVT family DNA-binding domain-containing protein [Trinickia sp.]|uniref:AbrB/MazE/SpoVT family DNA-binding domain-containing protein n=1 Tax=Trinickia sp. TaxID=2571163 RepID=UPI003F80D7D3